MIWFGIAVAAFAGENRYWDEAKLLQDMFPTADIVEPVTWHIDDETREAAQKLLNYRLAPDWTWYRAMTDGVVIGFAVFDQQVGQHQPISFAVQVDPAGTLVRHEIVVYRESFGDGVRDPRFRAQFIGRTAADPLVAGRDIKIVSGSTVSSKSMAIGVRRVLVLARLFVASSAASLPPQP